MTLELQILVIIGMLISMFFIASKMKSNKLDYKIGLRWEVVCIIILVFAIWPKLLKVVSRALGIYDPVNMLLFFGLLLAIIMILNLSMETSKQNEQIKKLTQELAILRKDSHDSIENKLSGK